jgi:hypothetical protein
MRAKSLCGAAGDALSSLTQRRRPRRRDVHYLGRYAKELSTQATKRMAVAIAASTRSGGTAESGPNS